MLWLVAILVLAPFLVVVLVGAPYLPAKREHIESAIRLLRAEKGSLVVDVGSGDGSVIKALSEAGYEAVGYEINPILVAVSKFRLRNHPSATIVFGNFWKARLPEETRAVFVFLTGGFINKLVAKLDRELGAGVQVLSLGFKVENHGEAEQDGAILSYLTSETGKG